MIRAVLALAVLAWVSAAWAASQPHAQKIAARSHAMKSMKQAMTTIGGALSRGQVEAPMQLVYPAKTLSMAVGRITALFPEGSGGEETEAMPEIWEDWPRFEKMSAEAKAAADALLAAVQGDDMGGLEKGFKALANECSACHKVFRERKG